MSDSRWPLVPNALCRPCTAGVVGSGRGLYGRRGLAYRRRLTLRSGISRGGHRPADTVHL